MNRLERTMTTTRSTEDDRMRTTEPSPQETGAIYSPTMGAFLKGEAVLADVYGLRRRDLYEMGGMEM